MSNHDVLNFGGYGHGYGCGCCRPALTIPQQIYNLTIRVEALEANGGGEGVPSDLTEVWAAINAHTATLTTLTTTTGDHTTKIAKLITDLDALEVIVGILDGDLATKQEKLVSGTTLKTVNGTSLLGAGNITVAAGEYTLPTATTLIKGGVSVGANLSVTAAGELSVDDQTYDDTEVKRVQGELQAAVSTVETEVDGKQGELVSAVNIKTVNGESLLGAGNIDTAETGYELPAATTGSLGGVMVGDNLTVSPEGVLAAVDQSYDDTAIQASVTTVTADVLSLTSEVSGQGLEIGTLNTATSNLSTSVGTLTESVNTNTAATVVAQQTADDAATVAGDAADAAADATAAVALKQDALVSGVNIKTVNGASLVGSGDVLIDGGGGATAVDYTPTPETIPLRGPSGELQVISDLFEGNDLAAVNIGYLDNVMRRLAPIEIPDTDFSLTDANTSLAELYFPFPVVVAQRASSQSTYTVTIGAFDLNVETDPIPAGTTLFTLVKTDSDSFGNVQPIGFAVSDSAAIPVKFTGAGADRVTLRVLDTLPVGMYVINFIPYYATNFDPTYNPGV